MNYWYTLQHGWVSKQFCWVKEVSQKRIYTILSPLCKTQEKCKLIYSDRRQRSNCLGKDVWKGQVDRITKVHTATSGDNNTFIHLIAAIVLGVHEYIMCVCVCVCVRARTRVLARVWLFATSQTVDHWAPLSMGFPSQEHWSGFPFPSPRDLPDPGMESTSLGSPALAAGFFTSWVTN